MSNYAVSYFSPVIKVVSAGCNLRCTYCFYTGNQPNVSKLSSDMLYTVLTRSMAYSRNIHFVWHGGEPTIMDPEYYRTALDICNETKGENQRITHSIQTNATLLDNNWIEFFKQSKFEAGVSLDGPKHVNDFTRKDQKGRGAYNKIIRGVNVLKKAGVKFGVIAVVNSYSVNYPDEIFNYMYSNMMGFNANPCFAEQNSPKEIKNLAVSPTEYANFVLRLAELYLEKDDPSFRVGPIDDLIKGIMGRQPKLCRFKGQCHKYPSIDSNGDVYPCDNFLNKDYLLGNLATDSFEEIYNNPAAINYYCGRNEMRTFCTTCRWYMTCKGGCMRGWEGNKHITDPSEYEFCQANKYLFNRLEEKLTKLGYQTCL